MAALPFNGTHFGLRCSMNGARQAFSLDANNEGVVIVFQALEAMTITRLWYNVSAITGTAPTYRISLQGMETANNPTRNDGTIKSSTNAYATFQPVATGPAWINLNSSYTCTRGEFLTIVIDYSSGTIDASNFASFVWGMQTTFTKELCGPHVLTLPGGVYTAQTVEPMFGYGSASKKYGLPVSSAPSPVISTAQTYDEHGSLINLPSSIFGTFTIAGMMTYHTASPTGTLQMKLYDSDGSTVLQSVDFDGQYRGGSSAGYRYILFDETTLSTLNPDTNYRLSIYNNSGSNLTFFDYSFAASDDFEALDIFGPWISRTNRDGGAGAWTDTALERTGIFPIFGEINLAGTGGAGSILGHPGMTGRMNG